MDYETSIILERIQIRKIASFFRKMFNIKTILFPVMKVLELLVLKFPNNLYYTVEEDDLFEPKVMASLQMEENDCFNIRIRMSVYNKAINGDRASICFICHEMCHFILIFVFDIGPKISIINGIQYAISINDNDTPAYKSMEWQAKALCGEVMIPYEICKNYTIEQIIKETNSSTKQAEYFINTVVNGGDETI